MVFAVKEGFPWDFVWKGWLTVCGLESWTKQPMTDQCLHCGSIADRLNHCCKQCWVSYSYKLLKKCYCYKQLLLRHTLHFTEILFSVWSGWAWNIHEDQAIKHTHSLLWCHFLARWYNKDITKINYVPHLITRLKKEPSHLQVIKKCNWITAIGYM